MGLVQCRSIGDALTALLRGKGIDKQMGRADEPLLHGRSSLERHQGIQALLIAAVTARRQRFGQDNMGL